MAIASCDPYPPIGDDEAPLRSALRDRGFEVIDVAWDAAFDWGACAAVLLRTTWDYHWRVAEFVAWCDATSALTRMFHGAEVVHWNIDKRYLAALAHRGVPIAPTRWLDGDATSADLAAFASVAPRAFLKPVVGANASDTLRFSSDTAGFALALAHIRAKPQAYMLQPYIASVERAGELSVIVIDGEIAHGVRKLPAAGDYRVQEDWGARDEPWVPDPEALKIARDAFALAGEILGQPLLYGRVDLLMHDGAYVLNELELIEPALFLRHAPATGERLAAALAERLRGVTPSS